MTGENAGVGGQAAQSADFIDAIYGNFPLMIGLIVLLTFVLLARAFRSLLLPLKAVILNLLSVGAAWGLMVLIWQKGYGSDLIWGIDATGSITEWVPLMVFAFLFGLSMDYQVFIISRMREGYDRTGKTDTAVFEGIGAHRSARDERRPDPLLGLRCTQREPGHRGQDLRDRAGARHPPGRDRDLGNAGTCDRRDHRPLELGAANLGSEAPARSALAGPARVGRRRRLSGSIGTGGRPTGLWLNDSLGCMLTGSCRPTSHG